jgi:DNA-directed RNA polymerase subunit RPC12/RpoP
MPDLKSGPTKGIDAAARFGYAEPAMPQNVDRSATVNIPCPQCGEKFEQTVAELEMGPRLRCPACGVAIRVDARKIMQRIKEAAAKAGEAKRWGGG